MDADVTTLDTRFSVLPFQVIDKPVKVVKVVTNATRLVDVLNSRQTTVSHSDSCELNKRDT